jgi:limonene-1,2-epoxide hydrolase
MKDSAEFVAFQFVWAINRRDVEGMVGWMTPEHRFVDSMGVEVEGRDEMREGWTEYFRMVPDYSIAVDESFTNGSVVVMLGMAQGTYAPDDLLRPENRWETQAAFRALIEDGKVAEWRVYADNEPMRQLMRQGSLMQHACIK